MGYNDLSEMQLFAILESARKNTENQLLKSSLKSVDEALGRNIDSCFSIYNNGSNPYYCKAGNIKLTEVIQEHDFKKSGAGAGLIALGAPILKKRFVTKGAAGGTSIASKYLSKVLPYKMPFRIYSINVYGKVVGTKTLGRGLGRLVPYVGWGLLAYDVIELLIEVYEANNRNEIHHFKGGGGGSSGGGGAGRSW